MKNRIHILLTIIFTLVVSAAICQDIIIKKDSTQLSTKLIDTNQTELKYKLFNYQDGPVFIISKNDVAYVTFENGEQEIYNIQNKIRYNSIDSSHLNIINPQVKYKLGDYIKFNMQCAIVVYNSFSNTPRKNYIAMTSSDEYLPVSAKQNVTFNGGINFLFGASPYIKHVVSINYIRTKSAFYHNYGSIGYSSEAKYKSSVDFVNIITGLRFTIFKKLYLEPLVSLSYVIHSKTTRNGTETSFDYHTPPYTRYTRSFENESTNASVGTTISLSPKISYELPVKKNKMEIYMSYNLSLTYRLPWYQFGIHIFPFKKLK